MFTGLVAELGTVQKLAQQGESYHLTVAAVKVLQNLKIGDSVAVNGACLTVVSMDDTAFTADVMPETVRLTNIGSLHAGDRVNLERTLRLCDGLDGHIVSGHVEGLGVIAGRRPEGIAKETTLGFKDVGDSVNLETDIIGKYVEQMLKFNPKQTQEPALNKNMLLENGFI